MYRQKKTTERWFFFVCKQIIAWLARKQQLQEQWLRKQQLQEQQLQERMQQQELQQQRELLLSYRKQPEQQQRSMLPKRETCSFLKTSVS
jgi:hypothetical protein